MGVPLTVIVVCDGALLNSLSWEGDMDSAAAGAVEIEDVVPLAVNAVFEGALFDSWNVEEDME